jgi:hypothetical protein
MDSAIGEPDICGPHHDVLRGRRSLQLCHEKNKAHSTKNYGDFEYTMTFVSTLAYSYL